MSYIDNPGTSGAGSGTVTSVAGGVGITNVPEPIVGAGTVNLDIFSLTTLVGAVDGGDWFPLVDVSSGTGVADQRKVTFTDLVGAINPLLDHGGLLGLLDDDHTQYVMLAGRPGGQVIFADPGGGTPILQLVSNPGALGQVIMGTNSTGQVLVDENAHTIDISGSNKVALTTTNINSDIFFDAVDPTSWVRVVQANFAVNGLNYRWPSVGTAGVLTNNGLELLAWTSFSDLAGLLDHGDLLGLLDDDHPQYLLLAGRLGGQSGAGGTATGDNLSFDPSSAANYTGSILLGANAGDYGAATQQLLQLWPNGFTTTGGDNTAITYLGVTSFNEDGTILTGVDMSPMVEMAGATSTAGFQRMFKTTYNFTNITANTQTISELTAFYSRPVITAVSTGDAQITNWTGLTFDGELTSVDGHVEIDVMRGVRVINPLIVDLAGVTVIGSHLGLDSEDITIGNLRATVRSAQNTAANSWFLLGTGTAPSSMVGGLRIGDNTAPTGRLEVAGGTDPILLGDDITGTDSVVVHGTETGITIGGTAFESRFSVHDENTVAHALGLWHKHTSTGIVGPTTIFARSRGTEAAETVVADDDVLARLVGVGYDGTDYERAAQILIEVDDPTPSGTSMGGALVFSTTPAASTTLAERLRVSAAGRVQVAGANLDINALSYTWPAAHVAGVLTNDGAGVLTWVAAATGTVTSVAGGVGITNSPEPITTTGTVDLDINSLTSETTFATGDLLAFVDVSVGTTPASQRKVTGGNLAAGINGLLVHNSLSGLTTGDPHTQYFLLAGRSGGQTAAGGTGSGDDITFQSTTDSTKGSFIFDTNLVMNTSLATVTATTANVISWGQTITVDGGIVGALLATLAMNPTVSVTGLTPTVVGVNAAPTVTTITGAIVPLARLFQHAGTYSAGTSASLPPCGTITIIDACTLENANAVAAGSTSYIGLSAIPTVRTTANNAACTMTASDVVGLNYGPSLTETGSSVLTITRACGVVVNNPTLSGTPTVTTLLGMDIADLTAGTTNLSLRSVGTGVEMRHVGAGIFGANAAATNASVGLEVQSTTKAFLPSRMTRAQRNTLAGVAVADGMLLYDSSVNQPTFRQNGNWVEEGWDICISKAADQTVTNNSTLQDDTDLQFTVASGETWFVELILSMTGSNTTGDGKFQLLATGATFANSWRSGVHFDAAGALVTGLFTPAAFTSTTEMVTSGGLTVLNGDTNQFPVYFKGMFRASGNATVKVQFANVSAASGRTTIMKAGSMLRAKRMLTV